MTAYLSDRLFLATGHSLRRFPPRFLAVGYPKRFRLTPNDPCPPCAPWIIRASSVDKFFHNILMFYTEKCVPLYATREMMTWGSLRKTVKKGFIWCQSITIWHNHHCRWSPTTPSNRKRKWRRIALSLFTIADENHRFTKGIHVTGTDTTSGPGIEELSC